MEILSDLFTNKDLLKETLYEYYLVLDLHNRIKWACQSAQLNTSQVASDSIDRQDKKSQLKIFLPGEKVLILLPKSNKKHVLILRGSNKVIKKHSHLMYLVDIDGRINPLHVNLLRKYHERSNDSQGLYSHSVEILETVLSVVGETTPLLSRESCI